MTTIDSYHTKMVAPEQSPHTSATAHVLQRGEPLPSSSEKPLEVTPEEEEAWINLHMLTGGLI